MLTGTARMLPGGRDRFVVAGNIGSPNFECSLEVSLMQVRGGINIVNGGISGGTGPGGTAAGAPYGSRSARAP